jgi:hypothetical protein
MPGVLIHHSQPFDTGKTEIIVIRLADQVPQDFFRFLNTGFFRLTVIVSGGQRACEGEPDGLIAWKFRMGLPQESDVIRAVSAIPKLRNGFVDLLPPGFPLRNLDAQQFIHADTEEAGQVRQVLDGRETGFRLPAADSLGCHIQSVGKRFLGDAPEFSEFFDIFTNRYIHLIILLSGQWPRPSPRQGRYPEKVL